MIVEFLINALMAATPYHGDNEAGEVREARMETIAMSIVYAAENTPYPAPKRELVAALYKLGKFESRYAEYVHDMRCHEGPYGACDFGRAVGNWQTWLDSNERRLVKGKDYQSTAYAALFAAEKFAKARRACGTLEGAFAMYATGKRCEWKGAPRRARETLAFMERMPWVVVDSAS